MSKTTNNEPASIIIKRIEYDLFNDIEVSKDLKISLEELTDSIGAKAKKLSFPDTELKIMFDKCDLDGDGFITYKEAFGRDAPNQ